MSTLTASGQQASTDESLSTLMQQYQQVGGTAGSPADPAGQAISEDDAMYAFSQAKLDGVKIMDLPDAPSKSEPQLDEAQSALMFQASEQERQDKAEAPAKKVDSEK